MNKHKKPIIFGFASTQLKAIKLAKFALKYNNKAFRASDYTINETMSKCKHGVCRFVSVNGFVNGYYADSPKIGVCKQCENTSLLLWYNK